MAPIYDDSELSSLSRLSLPASLPLILLEPRKDMRLSIEHNLMKR